MKKNNKQLKPKIIQPKIDVKRVIIRKSPIPFLLRGVFLSLIFGAILVAFIIILRTYPVLNIFNLKYLTPSLIVIFIIFEIYLITKIVFDWQFSYYRLSHDAITVFNGFVFRRKKTFLFRNIIEVKMKQTFLGRIFNFATVYVKTQLKDNDILLKDILNPNRSFELVHQISKTTREPLSIMNN